MVERGFASAVEAAEDTVAVLTRRAKDPCALTTAADVATKSGRVEEWQTGGAGGSGNGWR